MFSDHKRVVSKPVQGSMTTSVHFQPYSRFCVYKFGSFQVYSKFIVHI